MKVVGPSIVAGDDEQPQQWQFWRLQWWRSLASMEEVDLEAQGLIPPRWGHPIRYKTLLWCVEKGFVPFEGRILGGWWLPFESSGTKNEVPLLMAVAGLFFLFSRRPLRYRWQAENQIFYFIHPKVYFSYVVYNFWSTKVKLRCGTSKKWKPMMDNNAKTWRIYNNIVSHTQHPNFLWM